MADRTNPILITQPDLPSLDSFIPLLKKIWDNKWLTNNGEFHQKLELELANYLNVPYISLFSNGTLALITALQALNISGEVITTPYSFVATTHSLWWNNIKPVFVDIESEYGNIDANKIEAAITPKTSAILAVHVYGNPSNVEKIEEIAKKHNLKVIYDAAHAFGVELNGDNILNHGDLSILSFHATKVFNTFEGGAIISKTAEMKKQIDFLKNFGFLDEVTIVGAGINAKMNEFQAAIGLLQLNEHDSRINKRAIVFEHYVKNLANTKGIKIITPPKNSKHNYAYLPILVNKDEYGKTRDVLYNLLKKHNIFARRYFYPLISNIELYSTLPSSSKSNLPIANRIADEVICLPIYPSLKLEIVDEITEIINNFQA